MKINGVITTSISKIDGTSLASISKISGVALPASGTFTIATGGTVITVGNYKTHTFLSNADFIVSQVGSAPNNTFQILVVAGGGGGGGGLVGAGGGGGGLIENTTYTLSSGATTYPVVVGLGGNGSSNYLVAATNGNNSSFNSNVGTGGGAGGNHGTNPQVGGSGGGGTGIALNGSVTTIGASGTAGQGFAGGNGANSGPYYGSGGGGGGGAVGVNGTSTFGGNGGAGALSAINGNYYAGGGGGSVYLATGNYGLGGIGGGGNGGAGDGTNGSTNTGGGGGGAERNGTAKGGNGGSGIVIIKYKYQNFTAAQAYFNQVTANGGTLTVNEKTYITTFTTALGDDIYEFDRLWIFGLSDSIAARTSLVNPTSTMITAVNSPTFTASQGYTGNGTTSYLNTNYNPSTDGVKYTLNNATGLAYLTDNVISSGNCFGSVSGSNVSALIFPQYSSNLPIYYINQFGADSYATGTSAGLVTVQRYNSSNISYYKNSTLNASSTKASTLIPNYSMYICGRNSSGVFTNGYSGKINACAFGSSNYNRTTFYNALQALGTSIGWAV